MNNVIVGINNVFASAAKQSLLAIFLSIALIACGGDSGTSANDDNVSSSSVILSSSEGSSETHSSSSKKGDAGKISSSSAKATSSSSSVKAVSSSSSVILSSSEGSSSSKQSSSSKKVESSSSSLRLSSANLSSSSKKVESSSSEYVPFDHSNTLAGDWRIGENRYKTFVDPRNGRSYYYITITSSKTGKSVTVMAENLNIGEMVLGENNQNDDTKIERYCYNNDTTKCDEFGGLYQWAEVMQLPSRCNTESCSDLIQPNHQGICPDGWRLFTWNDYLVVRGYKDDFNEGVEGLRSTYGFLGTNRSGFSLTGAGYRDSRGEFQLLGQTVSWYYPEEHEYGVDLYVYANYVSAITSHAPTRDDADEKTNGFSVRCVKLE
jgi:Fibrobacter succinogenes major domain (Fib_succ_major).